MKRIDIHTHVLPPELPRWSERFGYGGGIRRRPALAMGGRGRCLRSLGMAGVQIGPHVGAWTLDAPELFPLFARAAELGAAVFVHPWDMLAPERMKKYWLPWLVGMPAEGALAIC